jgi:hypothetical protein
MPEDTVVVEIDHYAWWTQALLGLPPAIRHGQPECGYYRQVLRRKDTSEIQSRAIAVWFDDASGILTARIDGGEDMTSEENVWQTFLAGCTRPVSYETYEAVTALGSGWPDDIQPEPLNETVSRHQAAAMQIKKLKERFQEWWESVQYAIHDEEEAAVATAYAEQFLRLESQYDGWRSSAKSPHLAECNRIDGEWRQPVRVAGEMKGEAKGVLTEFLKRKQTCIDAEISRQRQSQRDASADVRAGEAPPLPEAKNERRAKSGAAVSKAVSLRAFDVYTVVDVRAAAEFIAMRNEPSEIFLEAIRATAKKLHEDGIDVPGVTITTDQRVA